MCRYWRFLRHRKIKGKKGLNGSRRSFGGWGKTKKRKPVPYVWTAGDKEKSTTSIKTHDDNVVVGRRNQICVLSFFFFIFCAVYRLTPNAYTWRRFFNETFIITCRVRYNRRDNVPFPLLVKRLTPFPKNLHIYHLHKYAKPRYVQNSCYVVTPLPHNNNYNTF